VGAARAGRDRALFFKSGAPPHRWRARTSTRRSTLRDGASQHWLENHPCLLPRALAPASNPDHTLRGRSHARPALATLALSPLLNGVIPGHCAHCSTSSHSSARRRLARPEPIP
jgi:hypothetical protein